MEVVGFAADAIVVIRQGCVCWGGGLQGCETSSRRLDKRFGGHFWPRNLQSRQCLPEGHC